MDVSHITRAATYDIENATRKLYVAEMLRNVELPPEACVSYYDVYTNGLGDNEISISVEIGYSAMLQTMRAERGDASLTVDDIPWADRVRPIGETLRAFHARSIEREITQYGDVYYRAKAELVNVHEWNNPKVQIDLTVRVASGGISPACKVETIETTEMVTRKKIVVTCPEVSHA